MRIVYNLSMSKIIRKSLFPVLLICLAALVILAGCKSTSGQKTTDVVYQIEEGGITFFGNLQLNITTPEFFEKTGFEYGDAVRVRFLDKDMVLPIVSTFSELDIGQTGLTAQYSDPGAPAEKIELFINLNDFAETYGIAEIVVYDDGTWESKPFDGIVFPIDVTLSMAKKGAFPEFAGPPLAISNERSAYEDLDDYGFANIRMVTTPGFGNCFFRGSSPIDNKFNRNKFADGLLDDTGAEIAINLADTHKSAADFEGYYDSYYYSNLDVLYIGLGVDYTDDTFNQGVYKACKYIADHRAVYYVHCQLGKDRTGVFCAILESLMGASVHDVIEDYMKTYLNYYDLEKDSPKYNKIAESNICVAMGKILALDCDFMVLSAERLHDETVKYLKSIGLTDKDIANLKANLARVR